MKKIFVLMVGVLLMTAVARAEITEKEYNYCVKQLTGKPYVTGSQVQTLCSMFPMRTIGCAMDMTEMGQSADIFEAVEYCHFPFPSDRK